MPIKSILTYWNGSPASERQIESAIATARRFDAHLSVATMGYAPEIPASAYTYMSELSINADFHARTADDADQLNRQVRQRLRSETLRSDATVLVTTPAAVARDFGERARYVDLVVLAKPVGDDYYDSCRAALDGALFHGDGAVLVCPDAETRTAGGAMIAWDASPSALRAVRRAHPFLVDADDVDIVLVDALADQMQSAESLALMLSRCDLKTSITRVQSDGLSDAEALKRHQVETGAAITICGAYAHSRFREFLLGGVTRDLPGISQAPLLLAH